MLKKYETTLQAYSAISNYLLKTKGHIKACDITNCATRLYNKALINKIVYLELIESSKTPRAMAETIERFNIFNMINEGLENGS
jgi:hypothetical protein